MLGRHGTLLKCSVRVRIPRVPLVDLCTHEVQWLACLVAIQDVWVRIPLGTFTRTRGSWSSRRRRKPEAVGSSPTVLTFGVCCKGSEPGCYPGSWGSSPCSPVMCPWPIGEGTGLPNQSGGFDSHRALLRGGLERLQHGLISRPRWVQLPPPRLTTRPEVHQEEHPADTGEGAGSTPAWPTWVHWCSGSARWLVKPKVRDRHPYAPLLQSRGPKDKTPGSHPGNDGSTPSETTYGEQPDTVGRAALLRWFSFGR